MFTNAIVGIVVLLLTVASYYFGYSVGYKEGNDGRYVEVIDD